MTTGLPHEARAATTERVASGLIRPVFVAGVDFPGYGQLLYIVEKRGLVKVMLDGVIQPDPFLDIDSYVGGGNSDWDERGLLGLAFHPDFGENGRFFVNYTNNSGTSIIARFEIAGDDPLTADQESQFTVMTIYQPFANHNGGWLGFGPDDFLYIAMGDGGSSGDPANRAQNGLQPLGKVLRIDVDTAEPYAIPPGNPFLSNPDFMDEIWSYGWRNPWRCSFDRGTGDFWAADVGQGSWEEVDFEEGGSEGGGNYGWRLMEGAHCFDPPADCDDGSLIHPIYEYPHGDGYSITGGYVYRGDAIPHFQGDYFFADYVSNQIWSLRREGSSISVTNRTEELHPGGGLSITSIASFGEDAGGELYIADQSGGEVFKIIPSSTSASDTSFLKGDLQLAVIPNPFNPRARIGFSLEHAAKLELAIYDVAGRRIRTLVDSDLDVGLHSVVWDGADDSGTAMPSGIYFARIDAEGASKTSKLVLIR